MVTAKHGLGREMRRIFCKSLPAMGTFTCGINKFYSYEECESTQPFVCDRKFLLNLRHVINIIRFIISFLKQLCAICICVQLRSMHVQHNTQNTCTQEKRAKLVIYSLFLHGPSIIVTWVMQFINLIFCKILTLYMYIHQWWQKGIIHVKKRIKKLSLFFFIQLKYRKIYNYFKDKSLFIKLLLIL